MTAAPTLNLRSVAIPAEHGGWGFLLEPVVLGLLVAPSAAGLLLGLSALGLFLARHPLKLAVADYRRGRRFIRTGLAERFALLYSAAAILGLAGALALAGTGILLPLLLALPLAALQLAYDFNNRTRDAVPEIAGPVALAAVGGSITLAGGWTLPPALALWALLAARAVPSVLYVRARLRLEHGRPSPRLPAVAASGLAALLALALWRAGLTPLLAAAALMALLARAWLGLYRRRPALARTIGFREMGFGLLTVLLIALGWAMGW